jgi:hypothetical protein
MHSFLSLLALIAVSCHAAYAISVDGFTHRRRSTPCGRATHSSSEFSLCKAKVRRIPAFSCAQNSPPPCSPCELDPGIVSAASAISGLNCMTLSWLLMNIAYSLNNRRHAPAPERAQRAGLAVSRSIHFSPVEGPDSAKSPRFHLRSRVSLFVCFVARPQPKGRNVMLSSRTDRAASRASVAAAP